MERNLPEWTSEHWMLRVSLFPSWPKKNSKKEHKWKNRSCLKVIHNPSNTIKSIRLILLLVLAFCGPIITDCQKVAAKWCFQSCVSVSLYVPRGLPCDHDLWCISPHSTRSLHPAPPPPLLWHEAWNPDSPSCSSLVIRHVTPCPSPTPVQSSSLEDPHIPSHWYSQLVASGCYASCWNAFL